MENNDLSTMVGGRRKKKSRSKKSRKHKCTKLCNKCPIHNVTCKLLYKYFKKSKFKRKSKKNLRKRKSRKRN